MDPANEAAIAAQKSVFRMRFRLADCGPEESGTQGLKGLGARYHANMSATVLMPVEEYLRSPEKPYREYRDGVILAKPMPTKFHSITQRVLVMMLQD